MTTVSVVPYNATESIWGDFYKNASMVHYCKKRKTFNDWVFREIIEKLNVSQHRFVLTHLCEWSTFCSMSNQYFFICLPWWNQTLIQKNRLYCLCARKETWTVIMKYLLDLKNIFEKNNNIIQGKLFRMGSAKYLIALPQSLRMVN
jgi:hypothetical protein